MKVIEKWAQTVFYLKILKNCSFKFGQKWINYDIIVPFLVSIDNSKHIQQDSTAFVLILVKFYILKPNLRKQVVFFQ